MHALHGPGFALLALLILWYLQHQCRSVINYVLAAGIAMGIGLLSEAAQIPGPRDAQIKDVIVDALGIFGAIGLSAALDRNVRSVIPLWSRLLLPVIAGAAFAIACFPSIWLSYALVQQKNAFPTLLAFESRWETATFSQPGHHRPERVTAPSNWIGNGPTVVQAKEQGRWGIFMSVHPLPDWSDYKRIRFIAASTGERFRMDVGIRESWEKKAPEANRYYASFWVEPEPQVFEVSFEDIQSSMKDRPFDFSRVESLVFSAAKPSLDQSILLDDIRLEL